MIPQASTRDAQYPGQIAPHGGAEAVTQPSSAGAGGAVPRRISGGAVATHAHPRAYDRIVLGMDHTPAESHPALAAPTVAPRTTGLFGRYWR